MKHLNHVLYLHSCRIESLNQCNINDSGNHSEYEPDCKFKNYLIIKENSHFYLEMEIIGTDEVQFIG